MIERLNQLQEFLDLTRDGIGRQTQPNTPAALAADRVFGALREPSEQTKLEEPSRLPVCRHLEPALAVAKQSPGSAARVANAFAALEPLLAWHRRPGAKGNDHAFLQGHGNALIIGPGGLEPRDDVRIGVSLLAPGIQYPDHRHPPEEIYLVLSPGQWRQKDGPWRAPGIGGLVYNSPDIVHAMRAAETPLLALWCLWLGDR